MAVTDYQTHVAVTRAVDQIVAALPDAPVRSVWRKGRRAELYDLRGRVDALPSLGIVCVFPRLRFGVAIRRADSPFEVVIQCPGFPSRSLNRAVVESQTGLHHEIAHALLGHDDGAGYVDRGPAYWNHPYELDAFLQQALAGADRAGTWEGGDENAFLRAALKTLPKAFVPGLEPGNRSAFLDRMRAAWREGIAHRAELAAGAEGPGPAGMAA